jgi:hypothetical protein
VYGLGLNKAACAEQQQFNPGGGGGGGGDRGIEVVLTTRKNCFIL